MNKCVSTCGDIAKVISLYMTKLKIVFEILVYSCRGHKTWLSLQSVALME